MGAARVLSLLLLLAALWAAPARSAPAGEAVESFASRVELLADGRLRVEETIAVTALGLQVRRGIYRDLPTARPLPGGLARALGLVRRGRVVVLGASRDGAPEAARTEARADGVRVYLGRPDALLAPGTHVFRLVYEATDQGDVLDGHDELHWNVTGTGWTLPILGAACEVVLPPGARLLGAEGVTGPPGGAGRALEGGVAGPGVARFATTRPLAPGQGLTIGLRLAGGALPAAGPGAAARLVRDNPGPLGALGALLAGLAAYLAAWWRVGRGPQGGAVAPRFGPPAGISPGAARYVRRMGFDDRVFAAALVGLAARGALALDRAPGGRWTVARAPGRPEGLEPEEEALLAALFARSAALPLDRESRAVIRAARAALRGALAARFRGTAFRANAPWLLPGLALCVAAGALALRSLPEPLPLAVIALGGALFLVFARLMRAPSPAGRALMDELEGFGLYLGVAEQERLNLLNPPGRTPEVFEAGMPYALALDCEQRWARGFSSALEAAGRDPRSGPPGRSLGRLGTLGRGGGLGDALAGALAASARSSGPGRGGGAGGGVGRGGGGGGGGGW